MRRRALALGTFVAAALLTAGCAPGSTEGAPSPEPPPAASATPSPTPTPTEACAVPAEIFGEIARVVHEPDGGTDDSPMTTYTAVDVVVPDEPFTVRGQCIGESVDFEVIRAAVDDHGGTLLAGTIECDDGEAVGSYSTPYGGLVQLLLTSTDDIERGWFVVVPA